MGTQQFCLRWNNHQTNLLAVFDQLLQNEAFVDVTLACEGLSIKAHKMVLSACSPYFQSLFLDNPCQHPIVILKDMRFSELKAVVDFMYKGEVNVSQDQLSALLKTAETLKVKGLAEVTGSSPPGSGGDITRSALGVGPPNQGGPPPSSTEGRLSPPPKRKRGRPTKRPSTDGEQLEVVESLVDVVPDGPDSVPPAQERSTEQSSVQGMELLTDAPTTISDHAHNTSEMAYDGPTQEQNSRDSSMILADQTQSSSSSLGHLPATASTSGMSPGQEPSFTLLPASPSNLVVWGVPGGPRTKRFQCELCGKVLAEPSSYARHKLVHNPRRNRFNCPLCGRQYTRREHVRRHFNEAHKEEALAAGGDPFSLSPHSTIVIGGLSMDLLKEVKEED